MFNFNRYRKKMFVNGRIQGRLMFRIGLYWVLYHVMLWHALFVFRYVEYRLNGSSITVVPFQELYGQFVLDYYPVIFCALVALPIVVLDMLHLTHRIAGPLVAFQNALRDLIAGKPVERVTLRKGDLLTDFQDEFNQYLKVLAEQHGTTLVTDNVDAMSEEEAQVMAQVTELRETVQSAIAIHSEPEPVANDA